MPGRQLRRSHPWDTTPVSYTHLDVYKRQGCMIYGHVKNSVVFPGVVIEKNALIEDSIIMSNSTIKSNSHICCTIVGEKTTIGTNVVTGNGEYAESSYNSKVYQTKITVIGSCSNIPDDTVIAVSYTHLDVYKRQIFFSTIISSM